MMDEKGDAWTGMHAAAEATSKRLQAYIATPLAHRSKWTQRDQRERQMDGATNKVLSVRP
jgi:hypothetical protein